MYDNVQVYKPTSYLSWLDIINITISFSKLEIYTKIHLSVRKMFVKYMYILIQYHFINKNLECSNCICIPFLRKY